jgi:hypothetical protein
MGKDGHEIFVEWNKNTTPKFCQSIHIFNDSVSSTEMMQQLGSTKQHDLFRVWDFKLIALQQILIEKIFVQHGVFNDSKPIFDSYTKSRHLSLQ